MDALRPMKAGGSDRGRSMEVGEWEMRLRISLGVCEEQPSIGHSPTPIHPAHSNTTMRSFGTFTL
jgi:hypothetical protein